MSIEDFSVIVDGELMIVQVEGSSDAGTAFLDAYNPHHEYIVIDSGRLLVPQDRLPEFLAAAAAAGLAASTGQEG